MRFRQLDVTEHASVEVRKPRRLCVCCVETWRLCCPQVGPQHTSAYELGNHLAAKAASKLLSEGAGVRFRQLDVTEHASVEVRPCWRLCAAVTLMMGSVVTC